MPTVASPHTASTPRGASSGRRRRVLPTLLVAATAVVLVAPGCGSGEAAAKSKSSVASSTTGAPTTTAQPTPTTAPLLAPLTGLATDPATAAHLARPALAIKIDNSPQALPQRGINLADVVIELRVEGISRLMAVFQSQDADRIGPTRSARFSDPDLLALFGKPLFGWSGANEKVTAALEKVPWVVNVNWNRAIKAYKRDSSRRIPHNLFTSSGALFGYAQPGEAAPAPIFDYLGPGESNTGALAATAMSGTVGTTPFTWTWDPSTHRYLRTEYGRAHATDEGQVWADNVVVLDTTYSGGKSPFANSVGSGMAAVLTGGSVVPGTWTRTDRVYRYTLTNGLGAPIKLTPGRTWIELPEPGHTSLTAP